MEINNNVIEDKALNVILTPSTITKITKKRKSGEKINGQTQNEKRRRTKIKSLWKSLEHKGPVFPPPYKPLPEKINFYYDRKIFKLSPKTEEVATFYAMMNIKKKLPVFDENFFNDWLSIMTEEEKSTITDFNKCDFRHLHNYFKADHIYLNRSEIRKNDLKKRQKSLKREYGFCIIDGEEQEIDNFKIEPPGLFNGRGEHPKAGKIKKRIEPEDIIINCGEDSIIPEPPEGHQWKEVRHDSSVAWLAKWTDNVSGEDRYVRLSFCSKLKIKDDIKKFDTSKLLGENIEEITRRYFEDLDSEEIEIRQRAVALYFIDNLGFRTGNEKDEDKADTVGCCSLRVEHVKLRGENHVVFNFLGKDSIPYHNEVLVDESVFKNLQNFQKNKSSKDNLFDCLATTTLNEYLNKQMEGLTAKVFRTYNASLNFEHLLRIFTDSRSSNIEKIRSHKCANLAIAILLNHRKIPEKPLDGKEQTINDVKNHIQDVVEELKETYHLDEDEFKIPKLLHNLKELLHKNREISLDTSKANYLDPRITVAWCLKFGIPVGKIYTNASHKKRFGWAIQLKDENYSLMSPKSRRSRWLKKLIDPLKKTNPLE